MDFTFDPVQQEVADLAALVFRDAGDRDAGDRDASRGDGDRVWRAAVDAGLLGLALPERFGGDGLGVAGAAIVLTEVGRRALAVPALATLGLGALPLAAHGTRAQQEAILPRVAKEGLVLTGALHEPSEPFPVRPRTRAVADGDSYLVTGTKLLVPNAAEAHRMLVPVSRGAEGPAVLLVDPGAAGVSTVASGSGPYHRVGFDGVRVPAADLLDGGAAAVGTLYRLGVAGAAAVGDGLLAGALELTATHVGTRNQFGRPLAAFQAVAQQIADVYIASRALHLAAWAACWRLHEGLDPGADPEVAAYWLAEELPAAIANCHHLHGGVGLDRTYPLHRYSAAATELARLAGGAERGLDRLADALLPTGSGE